MAKYTPAEIAKITIKTRTRLHEEPITTNTNKTLDLWTKLIELSFQRNDEKSQNYSDRLNAFFSGNFTDQELAKGWTQDYVYGLIASFEKVVRDASFVVPLMEVDTNWEVSKISWNFISLYIWFTIRLWRN
ncbi:Uncharacterised protein (plasmid) [Mycoplasmopsis gallopavonis]|uniref:Uncharacterized protein n=1 Tax=Mycoplasmopsis gallopavonis TaxID=76629 RepID=A0A449AZV5_9BACT|nr:hypothetical protein [Mycoplasmopsis gallopavonis]VEU72996.1 Uncharacterised protein [Mycoplasmopsis gallopavonis]